MGKLRRPELIGMAWSTLRESFVAIIVRAGTVFSDQSIKMGVTPCGDHWLGHEMPLPAPQRRSGEKPRLSPLRATPGMGVPWMLVLRPQPRSLLPSSPGSQVPTLILCYF